MIRVALIILISMVSCMASAQGQDHKAWLLHQRLPEWAENAFNQKPSVYDLSDYINPFYLEADFNGDGLKDIVIAIFNKTDDKKGLIIIHKKSNEHYVIGAGTMFGHFDDLWWMDIFKINYDLDNHKLTFQDDGDIANTSPIRTSSSSIYIGKSESSSGLIYWDGEEYQWAQMSD